MKFLFKLAIIIAAARMLAGAPRGGNGGLNAVADFSLRDVAHTISTTFDKVETAVTNGWSKPNSQNVASSKHAGSKHLK